MTLLFPQIFAHFQIIAAKLHFNDPIVDIVSEKRLHHQLAPMNVNYEPGFDETILQGLVDIGHKIRSECLPYGFVAVTSITREGNTLIPLYDNRRTGSTFVF